MGSIDSTFGAALLGLIIGACLYGITIMQTFAYFKNYTTDSKFVKSLVLILTVLDTLHLILCMRTIYWYLVTNFGNTDNLDVTTWSMAGLIGLIVEAFFARRVWMMSRNWVVTGIILILAALHFVVRVLSVVTPQSELTLRRFILGRFSKFKSLTWVTCLGLGAAAASDILIAGAMCYYLYKKRTGLKRTDSLVTTLMVYSINTGLTTSIIGTICVVAFGAMPTNFVWLGFFWIMGKCYVNSFLALLNSRDRLREKVTKAAVQLNNVGNGRSFQQSFTVSGNAAPKAKSPPLGGVSVQIETITEYSTYHPRQNVRNPKATGEPMTPIKDDAMSTSSGSPEV
ncbi:hypothetical protein BN946_scf184842.g35 [Trametes cinnabarina]|uniref:DUF6534 domain-containing protein n=1 Tax=Pycnoporus cinnabarinus TaxID=5643 RepID=A0A060S1N7_PYCCI|nr:hypothetical protein BN946_scf184842.g35 [Trametes cinnabarina]